ncbi:MAG: CDP-alcohol phosphatidyltransferase family protein [Candidatus Micrarchaeota archaeon]|nr:CDP-alcohol phosphatidyltransferase family protein [Candidatus Micrarchaeota archaeon]MDE1823742.1 CDP-alcohol phosphatidyltransferase family protein [Candidatus Micrarchaeota archaeon]MDE1849539.1 CDP-alcohol phosphatidyltransferase family protein [Candidatus Micrarchaeota archaeon]
MRAADIATVVRVILAVVIAYMVLAKFNAVAVVALIAIVIFLDAFDGFLAMSEESKGRFSFSSYARSMLGNKRLAAEARRIKERISRTAKHGARMDVAGDRAVEYIFWITFTYLALVPLLVAMLVVIRHSFVDAVMGSKGTSSRMKTRFARAVYSSNIGRGGINIVKFLAFSYLSLVYIIGYPIVIGYMLTALLVIYIMARGAAELYESM